MHAEDYDVNPDPSLQFERELEAQEMRNEYLIGRCRNVFFVYLLLIHIGLYVWHVREVEQQPWVLGYVVAVNLFNLAIWGWLRARPGYNAARVTLVAEFEFVALTVLAVFKSQSPDMPAAVGVAILLGAHLVLLAANGLRYRHATVFIIWLQAVLIDVFVLKGNIPPGMNRGPIAAPIVFLSITALCVSYVVTSMRRVHLEAVSRQHAAERKSIYLANVSHELKTPLTSILGYSTALADGLTGAVSPEQAKSLDVIRSNASLLLRLIEDLLDLSKLEAGKLQLELTDFNLSDCVEFAYGTVRPQLEAKNLHFEADMPRDNVWVRGDFTRLCQVFVNLIGNAIKYTIDGGVHVSLVVVDGLARVNVADTGPGIAQDQLEHIFDEFVRADRRQEGSGLGLAICRRLVGMHDGDISVRSSHLGTTFTVTLPVLRHDDAQD